MEIKSVIVGLGISLIVVYFFVFAPSDDISYVDEPIDSEPEINVKYSCKNELSGCVSSLESDPDEIANVSVCGLVVADLTSMLDINNPDHMLFAIEGGAESIQELLNKNPMFIHQSGEAAMLTGVNGGYPSGISNINQQYCIEGIMYWDKEGWIIPYDIEQSGGCMSFVENYGQNFPNSGMLRLVKIHCLT